MSDEIILNRRGSTTQWASPTKGALKDGEIGLNTTTREVKMGDGSTAFASLPALGSGGGGDVVGDTSPQLGGDLDPNGHTVGDATAADLTKLHGIASTVTELNYTDGVTSAIQTQLDAKAPLASPTFTGTVAGVTKAMVGLGSVDNTADTAKPVSTAQAAALALKVSVVTYSGSLSDARPTADAVYWVGYPSTPTNALAQDIVAGSEDADLTAIAALTPSNDDVLQRKAGAWTNRTPAQLRADLSTAAFVTSAGGTTTLVSTSAPKQVVTGSAFQQIALPTTGVVAGQPFEVVCETSGSVDVSPSGGGTIATLQQSETGVFVALQAAPTSTAHWSFRLQNVFHTSLGAGAFTLAARDANGILAAASRANLNAQTGTTYTFVPADDSKVVTATNASAQTYTVPQNSAQAIPIGAYIEIHVLGAGQVTLVAGTGATLNSRGGALKSAGQYAVIGLRKIATNTFVAAGDLST